MLSSLCQFTHLISETMQGILRFIIFTCRREKHFLWLLFAVRICLMLRFCWLLSCQYAKIVNYYSDIPEVSTSQSVCCQLSLCGTPTFFCARQVFMDKMFFAFYFNIYSDPELFASLT